MFGTLKNKTQKYKKKKGMRMYVQQMSRKAHEEEQIVGCLEYMIFLSPAPLTFQHRKRKHWFSPFWVQTAKVQIQETSPIFCLPLFLSSKRAIDVNRYHVIITCSTFLVFKTIVYVAIIVKSGCVLRSSDTKNGAMD